MQVSVYRFNPDTDESPKMREMAVELPEGKDLMVLDVLELLKTCLLYTSDAADE